MKKPVLCVLLGDASGVGAEIVVKAFSGPEAASLLGQARVVLLGDQRVLARAEGVIGKKLSCRRVDAKQIRDCEEDLMMIDAGNVDPEKAPFGQVNPYCGAAVVEDIHTAFGLYADGQIDGICFAPFNKQAIRRAGNDVASEMEIFEQNCEEYGLQKKKVQGEMNVVDGLWTTRVTSHVPLARIGEYLTKEGILDMIHLADESCRTAGIKEPRIMVAALNPHCGEGGLCGDEEQTMILPAIEEAKAEGINMVGMFSPDTAFVHAFDGEADAVVTMYHDQGQIALKLKEFGHAVTVSAGFPLPIGTPAHGTAHDIAGTGKVRESAFETAFGIIANQAASGLAN